MRLLDMSCTPGTRMTFPVLRLFTNYGDVVVAPTEWDEHHAIFDGIDILHCVHADVLMSNDEWTPVAIGSPRIITESSIEVYL